LTATSGALTLGQAKGAVGYIDVEGAQTTFDASSTPSMMIGDLGTGDLAVQDGASAHIAFASIGSSGEMYLSDPATVCTVDGSLIIGGADRGGSASVLNGAQLEVVATRGSALMLMQAISTVTVDAKSAASVGSAGDLLKGTLSVGDGGEFQPNDATVVGNVQVQKNGLILPNYCTVKGNYDQTYQGGGDFGVTYTDTNPLEPLTVSGTATLGGTLRARLFKGTPSVGEHIAIVKAKSITGAFASVVTTGFSAAVHQTSTEVYLEVTNVKAGLPVQTSAMDDTADEDVAFSYQAAATNTPKTYTATGLPPGLKIDPSTGRISGVPQAAGVFPVTLGFSNSSADGAGALMLTIVSAGNAAPPPAAPNVTLTVPKPMVKAGSGGFGEVAVHLLPAQTTAVTVSYTIGGTATNGKDYKKLAGSVTFPPGTMTEAIKIVPKGDLEGAMSKEVKIKLAPGTGYDIGTKKAKKVKIVGK
jgi:T5SS/PEP-CTERM-associated repeat protein